MPFLISFKLGYNNIIIWEVVSVLRVIASVADVAIITKDYKYKSHNEEKSSMRK